MTDFMTQLDQKFEIAMKHYARGKKSICRGVASLGVSMEIIALDSESGPDSRCLLARLALDSNILVIGGRHVISMGAEVPRAQGDRRSFEELSDDIIERRPFIIGVDETGQMEVGSPNLRQDWLSIEGLAQAISEMRVVEEMPFSDSK